MIQYKEGDLLKTDDVQIICHQVNTIGAMGAGIAKDISRLYPELYNKYRNLCKSSPPEKLMGKAYLFQTEDGRYIANIFGQKNIGKGLQTDYDSLRAGLSGVFKFAKQNNLAVGIPYKIGCGLAGGSWDVVSKMIDEIFSDNDVICCIYKLPSQKSN